MLPIGTLLLMNGPLEELLEGSTKGDIQSLMVLVVGLRRGPSCSNLLLIERIASEYGNTLFWRDAMCKYLLKKATKDYINLLVTSYGGIAAKNKSDAIDALLKLDYDLLRTWKASMSTGADDGVDAGVDGVDDGVHAVSNVSMMVPYVKPSNIARRRRKLGKSLRKQWMFLARHQLKQQRSKVIRTEIALCLSLNTNWSLLMIKNHVASKVHISLDRGHGCIYFHKQLRMHLDRVYPKKRRYNTKKRLRLQCDQKIVIQRSVEVGREVRAMHKEDMWYTCYRRNC